MRSSSPEPVELDRGFLVGVNVNPMVDFVRGPSGAGGRTAREGDGRPTEGGKRPTRLGHSIGAAAEVKPNGAFGFGVGTNLLDELQNRFAGSPPRVSPHGGSVRRMTTDELDPRSGRKMS